MKCKITAINLVLLWLFVLCGIANLHGAGQLISWSAPAPFNGLTASQILTAPAGTVVGAVGFGNAAPVTVNVGGNYAPVVFGAYNDPTAASVAGGVPGSGAYAGGTGNANLDAVLNGFVTKSSPLSITLINLTPGATYSVQLFAVDGRSGGSSETVSFQNPADASDISATFAESGNYYVIGTFTVPAGATSVTIQQNLPNSGGINALVVRALSFTPAINFTLQPVNNALDVGDAATFSAMATGPAPLTPQWQSGPAGGPYTNLTDNGRVTGSNTYNLTIANVTASDAAQVYVLQLTSGSSTLISRAASLSVFGYPGTVVNVPAGGNISAAVASVSNAGGGTVKLAAGTYSGPVAMYPNVTLKGAGSSTVIAGGQITQAYQGASNWSVENLVIDVQVPPSAVMQGSPNAPGIFAGDSSYDTSNLSFKNVEIKNASIAMQLIGVTNVNLTGCNFHDCGIGFSHDIYFVGCQNVNMSNCTSSWSDTGSGVHLDFIGSTSTYNFSQCDFSDNSGYGILCQGYNNSSPKISVQGCRVVCNGVDGNSEDGLDIDANGAITTSRLDYNAQYGALIIGVNTTSLAYFTAIGNLTGPNYSHSQVNNQLSSTTANVYEAELADGVTGPGNTADWSTSLGGDTLGAVDFNANHGSNGHITWPNVSAPAAGAYPLTFSYSNGSAYTLAMPLTVNGVYVSTVRFAPTGSWSAYSSATVSTALTGANNTVRLDVLSPGLGSPELTTLQVVASTPAAPSAPTGLQWAVDRNAPRTDMTSWIDLSWNAVPSATYYNIRRNGYYIATGVAANSYIDKHILGNETSESYTVTAVNAGGEGLGASVSAKSIAYYPSYLTALGSVNSISLACGTEPNTQYYTVYRSNVSGGPYTAIGTTASPSYTDNNVADGTVYYYVMTSYDGSSESLYSAEAGATPYAPYAGNPVLIDVNIGPAGAAQTGAAVLGAAGDQWNAVSASTGTLVNSTGGSVGVGLTLNDYGLYADSGNSPMDAATTPLMQGYAFGYSSVPNVTVSLSGLSPYAGSNFTLVVYAAGNGSGQGAMLSLGGGSTLSTSAASRQISQGIGVAYQTFNGTLAGGTLNITAAPVLNQSFVPVNGFQLMLSAPANAAPQNFVNYGFEMPAVSGYQYAPSGAAWAFSSSAGIAATGNAPQGSQVGFIDATGSISQPLSGLIIGSTYTLTFSAAQRASGQNGGESWNVTLDGNVLGSFNPGPGATAYSDYSVTFVASAATQNLAFIGTDLAGGDNMVLIDNVRLAAGPITYAAYQQQYFTPAERANTALVAAGADYNGDGVTNLMACALALDPAAPASGHLPSLGTTGGHLTLTYTRPKGATAWTTAVEVSSDLLNWKSGAAYTTLLSVTPLSANIEQATFEDNTLMSGNAPRFMRLKVTLP
jgi:hypothetical protein